MPHWLDPIQRRRAKRKLGFLRPHLPFGSKRLEILDLGAGEGFVAEQLVADFGCRVVLADVDPFPAVRLPCVRYDGVTLPFVDDAFDAVVLVFVLHHCANPEAVLREALRVAKQRVVIVESVFQGTWDHRYLKFVDPLANRLRSDGRMRDQEDHIAFKTAAGWRELIERLGGSIAAERRWGNLFHRQALFEVRTGGCDPALAR